MAAITGINPISAFSTSALSKANGVSDGGEGLAFSDILSGAMEKLSEVNDTQIYAKKVADDFAAGKIDDIEQVMIAGQKAEIALQFTMQIRTKILDAYNEIMRMQV